MARNHIAKDSQGQCYTNYKIVNDEHIGHDPAEVHSAYAANRVIRPQQRRQVIKMTKSGATPRVVLATLRQNDPKCNLISKYIYNAKLKGRIQH